MGTRADFYMGTGTGAEWLGSVALDGYQDGPSGIPQRYPRLPAAKTEAEWRAAVDDLGRFEGQDGLGQVEVGTVEGCGAAHLAHRQKGVQRQKAGHIGIVAVDPVLIVIVGAD